MICNAIYMQIRLGLKSMSPRLLGSTVSNLSRSPSSSVSLFDCDIIRTSPQHSLNRDRSRYLCCQICTTLAHLEISKFTIRTPQART